MRAKEYLQQIEKIDKLIENKIIEKEHWMSVATSTTTFSEGDRVQSSGSKQKMADAVCRYLSMEEEINAAIDMLVDLKQEVISTIEKLPLDEYDVLHKIYVQYLTFQEVGSLKDKSYSWVTTIHGKGLKHLQDLMDERKQNGFK